jgi:hypothetical protein
VEEEVAVSNKDRTSGLQCCAFCRRQAGAVDVGAPPLESGGAARIALVDGIDDSCFMVWQVIFKKFTAQDARGPQCTPRDCNLSESHVLYSCRACVCARALHVCAVHPMQSLHLSVLFVSGNGGHPQEH